MAPPGGMPVLGPAISEVETKPLIATPPGLAASANTAAPDASSSGSSTTPADTPAGKTPERLKLEDKLMKMSMHKTDGDNPDDQVIRPTALRYDFKGKETNILLYECNMPTMYWKPTSYQAKAWKSEHKVCDNANDFVKIPQSGTRWVGNFERRPGLFWIPYQEGNDKPLRRGLDNEEGGTCGTIHKMNASKTLPWAVARPMGYTIGDDNYTVTGFKPGWWENNLAKQSPHMGCRVYDNVTDALKNGWATINKNCGGQLTCIRNSYSPFDDPTKPYHFVHSKWFEIKETKGAEVVNPADPNYIPFVIGASYDKISKRLTGGSPTKNHQKFRDQIFSGKFVGKSISAYNLEGNIQFFQGGLKNYKEGEEGQTKELRVKQAAAKKEFRASLVKEQKELAKNINNALYDEAPNVKNTKYTEYRVDKEYIPEVNEMAPYKKRRQRNERED